MNFTSAKRIAVAAGAAAMMISATTAASDAAPVAPAASSAPVVDVEAAEALARREDCLKCHTVDKAKDGPAFKKIAAKYKNKPDAEERLLTHLKTAPLVKTAFGDEDEHRVPKNKDEKDLLNLVRWILSR